MANPFIPPDFPNPIQRPAEPRGFASGTPLALYAATYNYAASSKFLGYAVLDPPDTAVSASKLLGYAVLDPPDYAVSASKLLGYAILQPVPLWRFQQDWPNPVLRKSRFPLHESYGTNPNLFPPAPPPPPFLQDWPNPIRPRYPLHESSGINLSLYSPAPFVPVDFTNPLRRRHRYPLHEAAGLNINLFPPVRFDDGYTYVIF